MKLLLSPLPSSQKWWLQFIVLCVTTVFVFQVDNARDFLEMGGLALVIKDLNSTSEKVRSEAAFVIGSATQR